MSRSSSARAARSRTTVNRRLAVDDAAPDDAASRAAALLAELGSLGSERNRQGMARYGINVERAFGVSIQLLRPLARRLGTDHQLALALWSTGFHEARLLACFVDDPAAVGARQMEAWARDFDSWDLCDQACFGLFDQTRHAWPKAKAWVTRERAWIKRGGFALMAGLAVHDKQADDPAFLRLLPLIERGAFDERNFVKKAVNWALRSIGKRNRALNVAAVARARRIEAAANRRAGGERGGPADARAARWVAADALRELTSPKTLARIERARLRGVAWRDKAKPMKPPSLPIVLLPTVLFPTVLLPTVLLPTVLLPTVLLPTVLLPTVLLLTVLLPIGLAACATPTPGAAPASAAGPPAATTRYRVGDFVVYRYSGAYSPTPVVLREEVRAQEGNRLRIDVTASRGAEELRWVQVLTDTAENQRNNVIDALYQVVDGKAFKLENPDNRDAFSLYQWTLIMPEGRAVDVKQAPCERSIGGASYACTCTTGKNTWHGRAVEFEAVECAEFLWTHGAGRFFDVASGEDVHRTEVVEVGRTPDATATTLSP